MDAPHHIFQRALPGKKAFFTDNDRERFLEILAEQAERYKFDILAYCLLDTRLHIVGIPRKKMSLSKTVGRTNFSYTHYVNNRRKKQGQLWRNRFQSCALDDKYMKLAVKYVENQPVYEKLVRKPEKYPWSSAAAHFRGRDEREVLTLDVWPSKRLMNKWADFLKEKLPEETREEIRTYTQTGRPLGSDVFIDELERKFKQRLHPLPVGRPPRED